MATNVTDLEPDNGDAAAVPDAIGELEHREAELLYRESTETLRFVKNHQWKTVGATLIAYGGIIAVAVATQANGELAAKLMGISIVLACAVVFTLILYQFWTYNEISKIELIEQRMSPLFRTVRARKSKREGDWHRYLLLIFMMGLVGLGGLVVHLALDRVVELAPL